MKLVPTIEVIIRNVREFLTFKRVFYIGLFFKGLDGAIELFAAIALFFIQPNQIHDLIVFATHDELLEDPRDFIANFLLNSTSHISQATTTFLVIYLLIHAVVKLVAVLGIISKRLWAYPFALITLGILMLYQLYSIIVKPSLGIVLLTILDIIVLWLIAREYKRIRDGRDPNMIISSAES
jgi:uncharacterized membrane protein